MFMFLSELRRVMAKEAILSSTLSFPDYNILPTGDKWELDHKESWALKYWWFWTVVLKKTLEGPLDYKEIKSVSSKGYQSWIFIGRIDAEAKAPILWPPDEKNWPTGNDSDVGEKLKAGEEGDNRGWDGLMASLIQWTWVWASSGSCWWAGKPGVLQSMGLQRVRCDWVTELKWTGDKVSFTLHPNGYRTILGEPYLQVIASAMSSKVTLSFWNTGSLWVVWHMMWTMGIMVICMLSKLFCYEVSSLNMTLFEIFCQCIRWPTDKEFAFLCRRCRKAGLITGSGRSPGGGNGNPLQNSCLENSMDRGDWWAAIPRVTKNQTWLNDLACMHTLSMDQKLSKSSKSGASWASLIAKSNSQHASMMMKTNHTPSSVERV